MTDVGAIATRLRMRVATNGWVRLKDGESVKEIWLTPERAEEIVRIVLEESSRG